jgi:hypothetical protein
MLLTQGFVGTSTVSFPHHWRLQHPDFSTGLTYCDPVNAYAGRTLLPARSKLFKSHWSNQWLTSNTELRGLMP